MIAAARNALAELGMSYDDPVPRLKEQLRKSILAELGERNQIVLARTLGVDEPRMSDLQHGKLERFSLQKLVRLLAGINRRVELTVVSDGPIPWPRYGNRQLGSRQRP